MRYPNFDNDADRLRFQQVRDMRNTEIDAGRTGKETRAIEKQFRRQLKEEEKQFQHQVKEQEKEIDRNLSRSDRYKQGVRTILIGFGLAGAGVLITVGTRMLASPGETYIVTIGLFGASVFTIGKGLWQIARSSIQRQ